MNHNVPKTVSPIKSYNSPDFFSAWSHCRIKVQVESGSYIKLFPKLFSKALKPVFHIAKLVFVTPFRFHPPKVSHTVLMTPNKKTILKNYQKIQH